MKKKILLFITVFLCMIGTYNAYSNFGKSTPTARSEMASTLYDNTIYVVGGIHFFGSMNTFEAYDIQTKQWGKLPNLPKKLNHTGVASSNGVIYVSGGFFNARQTQFSNRLYGYFITEKQWKDLGEMPATRGAHFMIYREGFLHLIGGRNHKEIWSYQIDNQQWITNMIPPIPDKRDHITVLQDEDKLFVVGGRQRGIVQADCWQYDFETKTWSIFTQLPEPRGGQSACIFGNKIHVIGGEDLMAGKTYDRHDVYDLTNQQWITEKPLKYARHGFISEKQGNQWYIFGGGKQAGIKTLISVTKNLEIMEL